MVGHSIPVRAVRAPGAPGRILAPPCHQHGELGQLWDLGMEDNQSLGCASSPKSQLKGTKLKPTKAAPTPSSDIP